VSTDGHERLTPIFKSDALTTHAIAQGDLFEEVTLSVQQLCRGDEYRNVKIQLFLAGLSRRGPELVSEGETCFADIARSCREEKPLSLLLYKIDNDKKGGKTKEQKEKEAKRGQKKKVDMLEAAV
jgi:hypothetical protein